jgi:hypothetical protein
MGTNEETPTSPETPQAIAAAGFSDGPILPPTTKIDKSEIDRQLMDRILDKLTTIDSGQKAVQETLSLVKANQDILTNDVGNIRDRMAVVEGRVANLESGSARGSDFKALQARTSSADEEHAMKIQEEKNAREALVAELADVKRVQNTHGESLVTLGKQNVAQLAILDRLDRFTSNPHVKAIVALLGLLAAAYAGARGLK